MALRKKKRTKEQAKPAPEYEGFTEVHKYRAKFGILEVETVSYSWDGSRVEISESEGHRYNSLRLERGQVEFLVKALSEWLAGPQPEGWLEDTDG